LFRALRSAPSLTFARVPDTNGPEEEGSLGADSTKPGRIPVVHGVEAGQDEGQHQDEDVRKLLETRLNGVPLDFETAMDRYEMANDRAQPHELVVTKREVP